MPEDEPWIVDDVWSDDYERDVGRLERVSRGVGFSFLFFLLVVVGAVIAFLVLGGPDVALDWLFRGVGDD